MRIRFTFLTSMIVCTALTACGGGGGGDGSPDPSSTSWFEYERILVPSLREIFVGQVERSGESLFFGGLEHVREGNEWVNYYPTWYSPSRLVRRLREGDAGGYEGSLEMHEEGVMAVTRDVSLTPDVRPTGTLSVSGSARGEPVTGDDRPAHARTLESSTSYQLLVYSALARDMITLSFYFQQGPPLSPGTYEYTTSTLQSARVDVGHAQTDMEEITLLLESWSPTHTRGSFTAELTTGEYVHGLFDVPIRPD